MFIQVLRILRPVFRITVLQRFHLFVDFAVLKFMAAQRVETLTRTRHVDASYYECLYIVILACQKMFCLSVAKICKN